MSFCNGRVIYYCEGFVVLLFGTVVEYKNCDLMNLYGVKYIREHESFKDSTFRIVILGLERGIYTNNNFKIYSHEDSTLYSDSSWQYSRVSDVLQRDDYYKILCTNVKVGVELDCPVLEAKVSNYTGHTMKDLFDRLSNCLNDVTHRFGVYHTLKDILGTVYSFNYFVENIYQDVIDRISYRNNANFNMDTSHVLIPLFFQKDCYNIIRNKYPSINKNYQSKLSIENRILDGYVYDILQEEIQYAISLYGNISYDNFLAELVTAVMDNDFVATPLVDESEDLSSRNDFIDWLEYTFDLTATNFIKYKVMRPNTVITSVSFCYNEAGAFFVSEAFSNDKLGYYMSCLMNWVFSCYPNDLVYILADGSEYNESQILSVSDEYNVLLSEIRFNLEFRTIFKLFDRSLIMKKNIFDKMIPYLQYAFVARVYQSKLFSSINMMSVLGSISTSLTDERDAINFHWENYRG